MGSGDSFKKGKSNIEMILLSILSDDNYYYGYELTELIEKYSHNLISVNEGSLYPVLYRLLDNGYIHDEKRLVGKRRTRIYYHIEASGKKQLETLTRDYNLLNQGIQSILHHTKINKEEKV